MSEKPVFALMYDFDKTLSPRDMQEYGFIPEVGLEPSKFWSLCNETMIKNGMDQILAYMYVMCRSARGKMLMTQESLRALGRGVELFPGVEDWFDRINAYADSLGMRAEHYIISSGLKPIIEGTSIANRFERIYAAEFLYDDSGVPVWPAMSVNYTSKTQFIFRINKGFLDVTDNDGVNEFMAEELRPVPFRNMLYIGDGLTDVPCMKIVRSNGGHSIAVYSENREKVNSLILEGRVDFVLPADYTSGGELEKAVFTILDKASADNCAETLYQQSLSRAKTEERDRQERDWKLKHGV